MQPEPEAPTDRQAPIALWRFARMFFCNLHLAWGNPSDIAKMQNLSRKIHKLLGSWIRVGEAVIRHMLLIEAAALNFVPPASCRQTAAWKAAVRQRKRIAHYADKPEGWRVSFRCLLDRRRLAGGVVQPVQSSQAEPKRRRAAGAPSFPSAWPLALRYEALIRVFNNPQPYARRLARHVHAHPEHTEPLLQTPREYKHRVDRADDILHAARAASRRRPDSS